MTGENAHLTDQLASTERANGRLMRELDGVSMVIQFSVDVFLVFFILQSFKNVQQFSKLITTLMVSQMAELESRCGAYEESQRNSLTEQLNRLSAENLQLRDRNDELSAEVETLKGKLASARWAA